MDPTNKSRVWYIFVAFSILLSSIFYGTYKRTLSATLGEIYNESLFARAICDSLEIILTDPDHCQNEYRDYLQEIGEKI